MLTTSRDTINLSRHPQPPRSAHLIREYHKGYSTRLGREMEVLIFGHAGLPVVVFPTSCGRFYDFEDRGMVAALAGKIDLGQLQLFLRGLCRL